MSLGIYVLNDYDLYERISAEFPDREISYVNDIYLVPDIISSKDRNLFIGGGLDTEYIRSLLKTISGVGLKWHKNIYLDSRDFVIFSQDNSILINAYIRMLESNSLLDDAIVVRKLSDSLSRRELIKGGFIEDRVLEVPIIRGENKCISLDKCDLCMDACPFDAIKWSKPPEIIPEECMECGYCLNSCPSLIYTYPIIPLSSYELFLKTLRWSGDKNRYLLVIDSRRGMDVYNSSFSIERLGGGITPLHIPNALFFSQYYIILSIAHGYIPIIVIGENYPGYKEYVSMIEELNDILKVNVRVITEVADIELGVENKISFQISDDFISNSHISMYRSVKDLFKDEDNPLILKHVNLFNVSVEDRLCTLCEACVRKCPTNALKLVKDKTIKLEFNPVECIGCRMCELNCPENAITIRRMVTPSNYKRDIYEVLVEDEIAHCINCGAPIGPERVIRTLEERMRKAGIDEETIKTVRYCKKCKEKLYFKSLYR